jgi:hypothetical protein
VSFQDLNADTSTLVVIDDFKYESRSSPASRTRAGGHLYARLRTIADVITA